MEEEIECGEETYSDGDSVEDDLTEVRPKQKNRNEFSFEEKLMESSFLGTSSVHFGVCTPLQIFEQP